MKLIVGLGNPGKQYDRTRHNVGFLVLDEIAKTLKLKKTDWKESKKAQALFIKTEFQDTIIELIKPQTFMNNSGISVVYSAKNHNLSPDDIIVVHDDKDIPLGQYKIQTNRGSAGHNGIKSIIEHLGTQDFTRVRVGIAPKNLIEDTAQFVLEKFKPEEKELLEKIITESSKAVISLL